MYIPALGVKNAIQ